MVSCFPLTFLAESLLNFLIQNVKNTPSSLKLPGMSKAMKLLSTMKLKHSRKKFSLLEARKFLLTSFHTKQLSAYADEKKLIGSVVVH